MVGEGGRPLHGGYIFDKQKKPASFPKRSPVVLAILAQTKSPRAYMLEHFYSYPLKNDTSINVVLCTQRQWLVRTNCTHGAAALSPPHGGVNRHAFYFTKHICSAHVTVAHDMRAYTHYKSLYSARGDRAWCA